MTRSPAPIAKRISRFDGASEITRLAGRGSTTFRPNPSTTSSGPGARAGFTGSTRGEAVVTGGEGEGATGEGPHPESRARNAGKGKRHFIKEFLIK
jgi:hypothetical protein